MTVPSRRSSEWRRKSPTIELRPAPELAHAATFRHGLFKLEDWKLESHSPITSLIGNKVLIIR